MRDELHLMELVDRYLDGSMKVEERAAFETRANTNSELRQLITDQRVLHEGVARLALRSVVVRSAPSAGKGWIWPAIATVTIVIVATYAWMSWAGRTESDAPLIPVEQLPPSEPAPEVAPADVEPQEEPMDTLVIADTQVVIGRIQVPTNITPKERHAIIDSISVGARVDHSITTGEHVILLQNLLTPNGDGHNDRLIVPGGPYVRATMTVWNARKELVFQQESADPVWNGTLDNGQPAPDGYYGCEVVAIDRAGRTCGGSETVWLSWQAIPISVD